MSVRTEKVASIIREEVSIIFQRNFPMEEYGFMTVTEVRMTPDLKTAKLYVSVFGDAARKQKSLALLEAQKSFIRSTLGHNIHIKFTPTLVFYLDETIDRAMNLETIFKKIHKDEEARSHPKDNDADAA
ncbi:MAG: 30S ribosome-binding factor RbfA [Ignavibacteriales bacterium]|nr:30S ribosome-binding factor RbfA [Ignavibacteriales bacterium]